MTDPIIRNPLALNEDALGEDVTCQYTCLNRTVLIPETTNDAALMRAFQGIAKSLLNGFSQPYLSVEELEAVLIVIAKATGKLLPEAKSLQFFSYTKTNVGS